MRHRLMIDRIDKPLSISTMCSEFGLGFPDAQVLSADIDEDDRPNILGLM